MLHSILSDLFSGYRLARLQYFCSLVATFVMAFIAGGVVGFSWEVTGIWIQHSSYQAGFWNSFVVIGTIWEFGMYLWLSRRRFHDMDQSGWRCLTLFVPFLNLVTVAILLFGKGTDGPNYYGLKPNNLFTKARSESMEYRTSTQDRLEGCSACGSDLDAGANFCWVCGTAVNT